MLGQAKTPEQVRWGLQQFGAAPGGQKLMEMEQEAALLALQSGVYVTWRSHPSGTDCCRVGPSHRCFCGHTFDVHKAVKGRAIPKCTLCECKHFDFVPSRPEEVGDWHLPRRKGFNVHTWRAKCKCGQPHDQHHPLTRGGACGHFQSAYLCVVCEQSQESHETVYESEAERSAAGRPVGRAFLPMADMPDLQRLVLGGQGSGTGHGKGGKPGRQPVETPEELLSAGRINTQEYYHMIQDSEASTSLSTHQRPPAAKQARPPNTLDTTGKVEKSVRLMHESCGGRATGRVVNAYGLTEDNLQAMGSERAQARWLKEPPSVRLRAPSRAEPEADAAPTPRDEIEAIYRAHAPEKLANVPNLLRTYHGREAELLAKLRSKYCDDDL